MDTQEALTPPRGLRLHGLVEAFGALCLMGTLLGFFAAHWWPAELACHFRVPYALGLGGALLLLLGQRRFRSASVMGIGLSLNLWVIAPLLMPGRDAGIQGEAWKVLALNVLSQNREAGPVLDLVGEFSPDMIVLAEVSQGWRERLSPLEERYPFQVWEPRPDNFGIALLSRLPVEELDIRWIGQAMVPSTVARLTLGGRPLTVIGTHPLNPASPNTARLRDQQLSALARFTEELDGEVMVIGDLNTTSWSPSFELLCDGERLRDSRMGWGVQATWPAGLALGRIPLDHCLVSPGIGIARRSVGPDVGSDHLPLLVEFTLGFH